MEIRQKNPAAFDLVSTIENCTKDCWLQHPQKKESQYPNVYLYPVPTAGRPICTMHSVSQVQCQPVTILNWPVYHYIWLLASAPSKKWHHYMLIYICAKFRACWQMKSPTAQTGPRWQSGNTPASHLWDRGSVPGPTSSGKAGSCLPLVGSLQYRTLTPTVCTGFLCPSTVTTRRDMTCTVLKATSNPK